MVNRILIRTKVVQVAYAYFSNEEKNFNAAEKELLYSLDKSYELYMLLLQLMVTITDAQNSVQELAKTKYLPTAEELNPNTRFVDNRFVKQLRDNNDLAAYMANNKISWDNEPETINILRNRVLASEIYTDYLNSEEDSYEQDKAFWKSVFVHLLANDHDLADALEFNSLYWNDDLETISTFVYKTMNQFKEENGAEQPLLPMYKREEDSTFALELFRQTLLNADKNKQCIASYAKNWELDRIAFMDILIMLVALAEIEGFPSIPTRVSLNEYIEITKSYSTAKSGHFVNGILNSVVTNLKKEGILTKE